MNWQNILFIIGAGAMIFWGWSLYKRGALNLNKENTVKSLETLGYLALFLLAIILIAIKWLNAGG